MSAGSGFCQWEIKPKTSSRQIKEIEWIKIYIFILYQYWLSIFHIEVIEGLKIVGTALRTE